MCGFKTVRHPGLGEGEMVTDWVEFTCLVSTVLAI